MKQQQVASNEDMTSQWKTFCTTREHHSNSDVSCFAEVKHSRQIPKGHTLATKVAAASMLIFATFVSTAEASWNVHEVCKVNVFPSWLGTPNQSFFCIDETSWLPQTKEPQVVFGKTFQVCWEFLLNSSNGRSRMESQT